MGELRANQGDQEARDRLGRVEPPPAWPVNVEAMTRAELAHYDQLRAIASASLMGHRAARRVSPDAVDRVERLAERARLYDWHIGDREAERAELAQEG